MVELLNLKVLNQLSHLVSSSPVQISASLVDY